MKIELDLPQVPDGWKFVGYQVPKKGQAVATHCGQFEKLLEDWGSTRALTFERIEPEIDEELEAAKRKFPVGSYFKTNYPDYDDFILPVTSVENRGGFGINIWSGKNPNTSIPCPIDRCTPFPLPTWRCCDADKPKKEGSYFVREPDDKRIKDVCFWNNEDWASKIFTISPNRRREWLDMGER